MSAEEFIHSENHSKCNILMYLRSSVRNDYNQWVFNSFVARELARIWWIQWDQLFEIMRYFDYSFLSSFCFVMFRLQLCKLIHLNFSRQQKFAISFNIVCAMRNISFLVFNFSVRSFIRLSSCSMRCLWWIKCSDHRSVCLSKHARTPVLELSVG